MRFLEWAHAPLLNTRRYLLSPRNSLFRKDFLLACRFLASAVLGQNSPPFRPNIYV
jgi:hypothetical protein